MKCPCSLPLGVLLIAGCDTTLTGYPFTIHAIYEAPISKLRIAIEADGNVPAGADISEAYHGTVVISPLSPTGEEVRLTFTNIDQVAYTVDSGATEVAKWGWRDAKSSLDTILTQAGYSEVDADEAAEMVEVIGGVFSGPKAVPLDGQTEHLKVVNVDLKW